MKSRVIETIVGFIVLFIAIFFATYAYNISNKKKTIGYEVTANFENIDGIVQGSDVKMAGIKVGDVGSIILDSDTYYATIKMNIDKNIKIPKDSRVIVSTSGILGGKYIRLTPGASENHVKNGDNLVFTQSALNIEDLIGKLMYSLTSK